MGYKIKIITSKETLEYDERQIETCNTNTFTTTDPTRPIFEAFSNEGTITIKDTDLRIFNKAINGDFDNTYEFTVQIFLGDNLISTHIVNQRPKYDYETKTLTLNMGNKIYNWANENIKEFDYPLESKTLRQILSHILLGREENDSNKLSETIEIEYEPAFDIEIKIPYLPKTSKLEAVNSILSVAGHSIVEVSYNDENGKPTSKLKAVDMLCRNDNNKPIYKILPSNIKTSFVPSVILDNRFDRVAVTSSNLQKQTQTEVIFSKEQEIKATVKTEGTVFVNETLLDIDDNEGGHLVEGFGLKYIGSNYANFIGEINQYSNNNLKKIITFPSRNEEQKINPKIYVTYKQTKSTINGYLEWGRPTFLIFGYGQYYIKKWFDENGNEIDWATSFSSPVSTKEEIFQQVQYENNFSITETSSSTGSFSIPVTKTIYIFEDEFLNRNGYTNNLLSYDENDKKWYFNFYGLCGKTYILARSKGLEYPISAKTPATFTLIEEDPIMVKIEYEGVVEEIIANNPSYYMGSTKKNVLTFNGNNHFMQEGYGYDGSNDPSSKVLKNLFTFYQNGIRTGTLTVFTNKYTSTDNLSVKSKNEVFQVGDLVVPCKDYKGTPIMLKESTDIKKYSVYKVVNNQIENEGGATIQHLTLMESPQLFVTEPLPTLYAPTLTASTTVEGEITITDNILNEKQVTKYNVYDTSNKLLQTITRQGLTTTAIIDFGIEVYVKAVDIYDRESVASKVVKTYKKPDEPTPTEDIKGTWVFDSFPILDMAGLHYFAGNVNFTSNGQTFTYLSTKSRVIYYNTTKVFNESTLWANENYRTITITDSISEVVDGESLLITLKEIATKQTTPTYTVSGVWVFNDRLRLNGYEDFYVNFTSNGVTYSRIWFELEQNMLLYDSLSVYNNISDDRLHGFLSNAYKTVDFGTTPQEVSREFYEWLTENAKRKISFTIKTYQNNSLVQTNTYQAYEGMTWEEWANSEFNRNGYYISGFGNFQRDLFGIYAQVDDIEPSDAIISDFVYNEIVTNAT